MDRLSLLITINGVVQCVFLEVLINGDKRCLYPGAAMSVGAFGSTVDAKSNGHQMVAASAGLLALTYWYIWSVEIRVVSVIAKGILVLCHLMITATYLTNGVTLSIKFRILRRI